MQEKVKSEHGSMIPHSISHMYMYLWAKLSLPGAKLPTIYPQTEQQHESTRWTRPCFSPFHEYYIHV